MLSCLSLITHVQRNKKLIIRGMCIKWVQDNVSAVKQVPTSPPHISLTFTTMSTICTLKPRSSFSTGVCRTLWLHIRQIMNEERTECHAVRVLQREGRITSQVWQHVGRQSSRDWSYYVKLLWRSFINLRAKRRGNVSCDKCQWSTIKNVKDFTACCHSLY